MKIDLSGKKAVVTGGSSGIGAAIATGLSEARARVLTVDLGAPDDGATWGIVSRQLDVTDRAAVKSFFEEIADGPDILVNCAGIVSYHSFLDLDPAEWDRVLAVNLTGAMLCAQHAGHQMKVRGGGRIINITSIASRRPALRRTHYCVSKAGLEMLTQGMALELGPYGITVNAIAPGTIESPMTRAPLEDKGLKASILSRTPLGRLGLPQDVAGAAVFLASEAAAFITGQTIFVDGGQSL